jgi:hypothetical protein
MHLKSLFTCEKKKKYGASVSLPLITSTTTTPWNWVTERVVQQENDIYSSPTVDCVLNVMAHAQKPDFVLRRKGRVHLNWQGPQFSRLLTAVVCALAVVMLDTPCSEIVRRVLATHAIHQFSLHLASSASPCAITFQLDSTWWCKVPGTE